MNTEKYLSTRETAEYLQISVMTVHRFLKEKKFPFFRFGRMAKIPMSSLVEFKKKSLVKSVR